VADEGKAMIEVRKGTVPNNFNCSPKQVSDFQLREDQYPAKKENNHHYIPVIEALDGQLITKKIWVAGKVQQGLLVSDPEQDILKIAVINRYREAPVAMAFIKNFGLKRGAMASSVAHDSHNIVAVGTDDHSLCKAVNLVIREKGGISCVDPGEANKYTEMILPLPIAGLMSEWEGIRVAETYTAIDNMAKSIGSGLSAPFMTLSFMALLVIPELKLSDLGLFDGIHFRFI
jgi:adenine deaminase